MMPVFKPSNASAAKCLPNIVIIFIDDMGYADVGAFGAKYPTPNIDRMAKEGIRFTDFHVSQAVCRFTRITTDRLLRQSNWHSWSLDANGKTRHQR